MARSRPSSRGSTPPMRRGTPPAGRTSHSDAPGRSTNNSTPVTNVFVQRSAPGGGMLSTMAGVAAGSVIGHGISNYLYGGNTQAPTQPAEAQNLAAAASQEGHVCAPQLVGYSKCLENNPNSTDSCKWAWDYFLQCQEAHPTSAPSS